MKKFKGFEEAQKRAQYSGSSQLPVGGYVAKVQDVRYEEGQNGNSDRIVVAFDIAEGEFAGFFKKQFDENQNEDKKWKGKATIYIPKDDGSQEDEWTQTAFARWTNAFEDSNTGYKWDWQEKKWKGLLIGVIYGEVGTKIEGRYIKYTECRFPAAIKAIRENTFKLPKFKAKNGFSEELFKAQTDKASDDKLPDEFVNVPEGSPQEIPF